MRACNIDTQIRILWASSWRRRGIKGTELRESNEGHHSRQGKRRSNTAVAQILEISMGERRVFFAERCNSFVGGIKNRRGFAATVLLVSANYGLNKTNIFLIVPSYKKTPHECKGLHGSFRRGFFEGSMHTLTG
jgi:hypothetical protein